MFGVQRNAQLYQLESARNEWISLLTAPDYVNKRQKLLAKEDIDIIYFVLTNPELRDLYDKHQIITTRDEY